MNKILFFILLMIQSQVNAGSIMIDDFEQLTPNINVSKQVDQYAIPAIEVGNVGWIGGLTYYGFNDIKLGNNTKVSFDIKWKTVLSKKLNIKINNTEKSIDPIYGFNIIDFDELDGLELNTIRFDAGNSTLFAIDNIQIDGITDVPEPATVALIGASGLFGILVYFRRFAKCLLNI